MRSAVNVTLSSILASSSSSLFPNWRPNEIRFSNRWGQQRSLSHSLAPLDHHQSCTKRRDQIRCGMGGAFRKDVFGVTVVWWDLNTCPVPAGVDPRCVRGCIESALEEETGRTAVTIYAMGNLEYISNDLLEKISSSGIILTHAPCGVNDLSEFLGDWRKSPYPPHIIMVISGDYDMIYPPRFQGFSFTNFVAYPKGVPLAAPLDQLTVFATKFAKVFDKVFVWETLLTDNLAEETLLLSDNNTCDEEPLCICYTCNDEYQVCDEFTTHLKSDEHRNQSLKQAACIDRYGMPKHFCQVCNHPVYGSEYNLLLHNQCEEHKRKLVEKHAQEEEDCESRKTNPELDLFY
ncbi:hypothetical protein HA466_0131580 [Hirschfeldia incana]|nr:hypothetical protein HA466_0131580 [Hirschfeldia incana]